MKPLGETSGYIDPEYNVTLGRLISSLEANISHLSIFVLNMDVVRVGRCQEIPEPSFVVQGLQASYRELSIANKCCREADCLTARGS